MEIEKQIQLILDTALYPFGIRCYENKRGESSGDEYVIYKIISSPYTAFANNLPILRRYHVDISYYAIKKKRQQEKIKIIEKVMCENGWLVSTPDMKIPLLEETDIVGYVIEFCKEQVV